MGTVGKMEVILGADNADLKKGLKESEGLINSTVSKISSIKGELLSLGAMAMPIAAAKEWAAAVNDLEDKTNMAGESASRLLAVGQYVGLSTEEMSGAMAKMSKTAMTAAQAIATATESGRVSTDVFTKFGIQILDNDGKLLNAEQILANVTAKHRSMANGVAKTAMEMEIFGRSGAKLNDLLNLTQGQFDEVYRAAEKSGLVLSHETTQAFEDASQKINQAKMSMKGLAVQIGAELLPQFEALADGTKDVAKWFSELEPETRKLITVSIEAAGAIGAVTIAGKGVMAIAGPWIGAIGSLAAAYDALKISALGAFKSAALIGGGAIAIGSAVGAATVGAYAYANDLSFDEIKRRYSGGNESNVNSSDDWDVISDGFDSSKMTVDAMNRTDDSSPDFNVSTGSSGGGAKGNGAANKMAAEVNRINEKVVDLKKNTESLVNDFNDFHIRVQIDGLTGSEKVYAEIEQEKTARLDSVQEWQDKFISSREEAEALALSAAKAGDDAAIASANERVEQCKALEVAAAQDAKVLLGAIEEKYTQDVASAATQRQAYQADLDEAMRQGKVASYMAAMEAINEADAENRGLTFAEFEADLAAKQELMQQYHDWRMEAEETYAQFGLEAADTMKNGLANAISDAVVNGKNLGKALQDVGKQIVAMFIQWQVKRIAAAALGKTLATKESAIAQALTKSETPGLVTNAIAYETVHPGASARAAMSVPASITAGIGAVGFASGGVVTAPTFALIGEGKDKEAVLPLNTRVLSRIADGIFNAGDGSAPGGEISIIQNNYGDINTGADREALFEDFSDIVLAGLRGR